jgi:hypothetical protein
MADQPHDRPEHRRLVVLRDHQHPRRSAPPHHLGPRVGNVTEGGIVASSEVWSYDPASDHFTQIQPWSPGLLERLRRRGLNPDLMLPEDDQR